MTGEQVKDQLPAELRVRVASQAQGVDFVIPRGEAAHSWPGPMLLPARRACIVALATGGALVCAPRPCFAADPPAMLHVTRSGPEATPPVAALPARPALRKVVKAPAATSESALNAETALVLEARAALRAGDSRAALASLDEARSRFAGGALVEEREALAIEALALAGRDDDAAVRAAAFLRAHPASLHADAVRRFAPYSGSP